MTDRVLRDHDGDYTITTATGTLDFDAGDAPFGIHRADVGCRKYLDVHATVSRTWVERMYATEMARTDGVRAFAFCMTCATRPAWGSSGRCSPPVRR